MAYPDGTRFVTISPHSSGVLSKDCNSVNKTICSISTLLFIRVVVGGWKSLARINDPDTKTTIMFTTVPQSIQTKETVSFVVTSGCFDWGCYTMLGLYWLHRAALNVRPFMGGEYSETVVVHLVRFDP